MTTKHTGPPWKLKTFEGMNGPQAVSTILPGGVEAIICLFIRSIGMSKEESLANAALIQKAPDLFRVMDDVNDSLYRVDGDPEDLLRINRRSLDPLTALLNHLRGASL